MAALHLENIFLSTQKKKKVSTDDQQVIDDFLIDHFR